MLGMRIGNARSEVQRLLGSEVDMCEDMEELVAALAQGGAKGEVAQGGDEGRVESAPAPKSHIPKGAMPLPGMGGGLPPPKKS